MSRDYSVHSAFIQRSFIEVQVDMQQGGVTRGNTLAFPIEDNDSQCTHFKASGAPLPNASWTYRNIISYFAPSKRGKLKDLSVRYKHKG